MSPPNRLLLVGAGSRVTGALLPALTRAALAWEVAGIVDPAPGVRDWIADPGNPLSPATPVHARLTDALEAARFDAAIVACPHDQHHETTLRLLHAGTVVWKEKPFALTVPDALELAQTFGPGLRVLAHRPHSQLYALASSLLPGWGRLLSYRIKITRDTSDYSSTWRASATRAGGGAICDLGYHAFDLIARLAPPGCRVSTLSRRPRQPGVRRSRWRRPRTSP